MNDHYPIYWIMTPLGAVWVNRWFSRLDKKWYYSSHTRNVLTNYKAIMDDYGFLVEV